MGKSKLSILILLVALGFSIGPVSAVDIYVPSTSTNQDIQDILDINATDGDNIIFNSGATHTGIHLNCSKALNFIGNGATLVGTGSNHVLTITGSSGITIRGLTFNVNGYKNGITGSEVFNAKIENNTIKNGGDGINIFRYYRNLTINNNTITNMSTSYGDGISLVNHNATSNETTTSTTVSNNVIDDVVYGIFLGGNFKGNVTSNTITDAGTAGMNITGKKQPYQGCLIADITSNTITSSNIGISMENPDVIYINLSNNDVTSTADSLLKGIYFRMDPNSYTKIMNSNTYNNAWDDLEENGAYWP
ncbi:right-handed parallel beta-helix repeat-containing protein [Methanobacterium formicicum]|uniref:right-handed parallel beta-helix repeat-containing protein n=1 Tax=Methanobacterium formicicum TaxID=2162 RepID=UPI002412AC50|nr:right-handed parallel beta-helix repeat-containing protein [Methanobacterium formicicum]MDG3547183.1 right-handed parallel beta-helix repeat-containing protein [Methanobacterium formicicum]